MTTFFRGITKLPKVLKPIEKIALTIVFLLIIGAGIFWWRDIIANWTLKPVKGGTYTEGVLANDPQEIDQLIAKLTKVGLTYINHKGEIQGALAEKWEIAEDGKKYVFTLRQGLNAAEIADTYASLPTWQNITITSENNLITMSLKQPFAPLLAFASDPVYDAGPYVLEKETKTELVMAANPTFTLGEPNLQRLVLTFYPDEQTLKGAMQRQEVMSADQPIKGIGGTSIKTLTLTKQNVVLFNIDKPMFKDKALREKIKNSQKLDQPMTATLVTTQDEELLKIANEFADKAKKIGLDVSIKSLNPIVLERDILPNDQYDLVVTSLNYGYDQDPYPYWHSSQVIGNGKNYAGYINKDADKLIEQARQTIDANERQKLYDSFYSLLESDVPGIIYPYEEYQYTVSNRLKGATQGTAAVPADRYTEAWKWFLKAKREPKS